MEGLSGKADDTKTGRIPVATLDLYLAERVKDPTQRQQKPVTVKPAAVGDFPLALVQYVSYAGQAVWHGDFD